MVAPRILIVASDVRVRRRLKEAIAADGRFEVSGVAASGRIAVAKLDHTAPDGVLMDPSLTEERASEVANSIRATHPNVPIVAWVSENGPGRASLRKLAAAGAEVISARDGDAEAGIRSALDVFSRVFSLRGRPVGRQPPVVHSPTSPAVPRPTPAANAAPRRVDRIDLLAIGSSTGGPRALEVVVTALSGDFPVPVVITQHMPPVFTKNLGIQLDRHSQVRVKEAEPGDVLEPGVVYIAPGDYHLEVKRKGARYGLETHQGPPENSCRPAVDVMLRSVIKVFGSNALTVILTGMGQDGLRGCEVAREAGGPIYVQDEETSVVWGMPGFVAKAGLADKILPIDAIATEIERRVWIARQRPLRTSARRTNKAV